MRLLSSSVCAVLCAHALEAGGEHERALVVRVKFKVPLRFIRICLLAFVSVFALVSVRARSSGFIPPRPRTLIRVLGGGSRCCRCCRYCRARA